MEKQVKKIINWIKKNYDSLPESIIEGKKLVIFATGDFRGEYGFGSSDLKAWGVDESGKLFWAYASGCSCNCGAGTEEKTIKIFEVEKFEDDTDIVKAVGLFNTNKDLFKKSINSYEYKSW